MKLTKSPAGAIVFCALGALLVVLASGRQWSHTKVTGLAGAGEATLTVTGHQVEAAMSGIGIALFALAAAILASSGVMRRLVGVVVVLLGAGAIAAAVAGRNGVSSALENREVGTQGIVIHATANGWWVVSAIGGLLAVAAGALTVFRSRQWSQMSAKYDAPAAPKPTKDPAVVAWDALDRGEDPTE